MVVIMVVVVMVMVPGVVAAPAVAMLRVAADLAAQVCRVVRRCPVESDRSGPHCNDAGHDLVQHGHVVGDDEHGHAAIDEPLHDRGQHLLGGGVDACGIEGIGHQLTITHARSLPPGPVGQAGRDDFAHGAADRGRKSMPPRHITDRGAVTASSDGLTQHFDGAAETVVEAQQPSHYGRLAGAVGAEQGHPLRRGTRSTEGR